MVWARVTNDVAVEVIAFDPDGRFVPEVVAMFSPVPDGVVVGSVRGADGNWTAPQAPDAEQPAPVSPAITQVSPVEFKLLFTSSERLAIKAARAYQGDDETALAVRDALNDFYEIVDDPRLTYVDLALESTRDAIEFLAGAGLIEPARVPEILTGRIR